MNFPDKNYLMYSVRGCLELALFLRRGADRFQNDLTGFWFSFLIPVLLIPLNILQAYSYPEFGDTSWPTMLVVFSYQIAISTAFLLGSVWLLCWPLDRRNNFLKFGTAYNWLSIVGCVVFLPYMLVFGLTSFSAEELSHLLITTIGLFYCVLCFTIRHTLNVSWIIALLITGLAAGCELLAALMLF